MKHNTGISFEIGFVDRLSNGQQLLECSVTETVKYSGPRWRIQPTPSGLSVPRGGLRFRRRGEFFDQCLNTLNLGQLRVQEGELRLLSSGEFEDHAGV